MTTNVNKYMRRCTDCPEHSGMVEQFKSGKDCMQRLEEGIDKLRKDFTDHVDSSAKSTIAMLVGIIMCFLTGVVGIYINHVDQKDKFNNQVQMQLLTQEISKAIKESGRNEK